MTTMTMSSTLTRSRPGHDVSDEVETPTAAAVVQVTEYLSEPIRPVIERMSSHHVVVHEDQMLVGRPYPYQIGEDWLVAVRRMDGRIDVYSLTV
jgi:hypothetical protein